MIVAFHFNLMALSGIALMVGLMLIYNSMSVSVAAHRDEIGMLQAGAGRGMVLALFLGEVGLLAGQAPMLGLAMAGGSWHAGPFRPRRKQWVPRRRYQQDYRMPYRSRAARSSWHLPRGWVCATCGRIACLCAGEYSTLGDHSALGGKATKRPRTALSFDIVLAALGLLATQANPIAERPIFGFLAQFLLTLRRGLSFAGLVVADLPIHPRLGLSSDFEMSNLDSVGCSNLLSAVSRIPISVATGISVSLAMMVSISVMVGGFRRNGGLYG